MTKGKTEETEQKPRRAAFRPTQAQRAFVAAAAGLGVRRRVICQMLPGAKSGEVVSISAHMLRDHFARELREGLRLVVALAGARLFQRAISGDDRGALTAQMMILNARGWKLPAEPLEEAEPELSLAALSREERNEMRRLLDKAAAGQEGGRATADDAEERGRRRGGIRPV
jgi:hypothetical protein